MISFGGARDPQAKSLVTGKELDRMLQKYTTKLRLELSQFASARPAKDPPGVLRLRVIRKDYECNFTKCLCNVNGTYSAEFSPAKIAWLAKHFPLITRSRSFLEVAYTTWIIFIQVISYFYIFYPFIKYAFI